MVALVGKKSDRTNIAIRVGAANGMDRWMAPQYILAFWRAQCVEPDSELSRSEHWGSNLSAVTLNPRAMVWLVWSQLYTHRALGASDLAETCFLLILDRCLVAVCPPADPARPDGPGGEVAKCGPRSAVGSHASHAGRPAPSLGHAESNFAQSDRHKQGGSSALLDTAAHASAGIPAERDTVRNPDAG